MGELQKRRPVVGLEAAQISGSILLSRSQYGQCCKSLRTALSLARTSKGRAHGDPYIARYVDARTQTGVPVKNLHRPSSHGFKFFS